MQDQEKAIPVFTTGINATRSSLKGRKREWKDLAIDALAEGCDQHNATYIVGRTPLTWSQLSVGAIFSRSKAGKCLFVKLNASKAICIDTSESLEVAPKYRPTLQVYKVTSFNSTTTGD